MMGIPTAVMDATQTALRSRLGSHAREATMQLLIHARQSAATEKAWAMRVVMMVAQRMVAAALLTAPLRLASLALAATPKIQMLVSLRAETGSTLEMRTATMAIQ